MKHEVNNQNLFHKLRDKHPEFIYSGYDISESDLTLDLDFRFSIPGLASFNPRWKIAKQNANRLDLTDPCLNELVYSLGMVELISYWKLTCSPKVHVSCGSLTAGQSDWWKKLYRKGLGEYFYTNGISVDDSFMTITAQGENRQLAQKTMDSECGKKVLVPIGGGKDSAVSLEILDGYADRYCYIINPQRAATGTVSAAKIQKSNIITAKRTLDKSMLDLNKQGFLNGHTPFSALVAFSSVIAAYIHGIEYVALSNESSASEPTVQNSDVNHQYSKSLEFETDFIEYEKRYIASKVKYFSLLRPLTEIGIARIFSHLEKYHNVFLSCNVGSKNDKWCASCPKCLFVYITLAPFMDSDKLTGIFGKDMLDDEKMIPVLKQLVGVLPEKPFECVGSRDEVNAAMQEITRQYEASNLKPPKLVKSYMELGIIGEYDIQKMCNEYSGRNHVPEQFAIAVRNMMKRSGESV